MTTVGTLGRATIVGRMPEIAAAKAWVPAT
jgi:hypothetical protein